MVVEKKIVTLRSARRKTRDAIPHLLLRSRHYFSLLAFHSARHQKSIDTTILKEFSACSKVGTTDSALKVDACVCEVVESLTQKKRSLASHQIMVRAWGYLCLAADDPKIALLSQRITQNLSHTPPTSPHTPQINVGAPVVHLRSLFGGAPLGRSTAQKGPSKSLYRSFFDGE